MGRIKSSSWIFISLAILAGITSLALAQKQALVPNREVSAKKGLPANFTCLTQGVPVNYCIWELIAAPGQKGQILDVFPDKAKAGQRLTGNYYYSGDGFDKGECGIELRSVQEGESGIWQCTLISGSGSFRGQVSLNILQKPSAPAFDKPTLPPMIEDSESAQPDVTCYTTNGVPRPKLQWFIGEEPLTSDLQPVNETSSGPQTYTFQVLKRHKFTYKDNGKKLRCVVLHEALGDSDVKEIGAPITIRYRPRSIRPDGSQTGQGIGIQAQLGEPQVIALNITANPEPKFVWSIGGKTLAPGRNNGEYDVMNPRTVGPDVYEVALKINSVNEEDLEKRIQLKVSNLLGEADYVININSSSSGSDGLSAGGILGIVLAVLVLVIIVAAGVAYTRARGLLCFKGDDGTASEKERMDGGSTGGTPEESKPPQTQGFASRLSAFYENLLKKKDKGQPVPVDEEAPKEKEPQEKQPEGEGDSKEAAGEKKGDDIVYAELDLARESSQRPEVVVRSDDKTEYAEIVGVVPSGNGGGGGSPKKTPEGSPKK